MKQASVKIETLDDFLGRARKLARLADAGKPIPESFVISFEDPADMLAVFSPAPRAVFHNPQKKTGMDRMDREEDEARPQRSYARRCGARQSRPGYRYRKNPSGSRTDERSARPR